MDVMILPKGGNFVVQDLKNRVIYVAKKKDFKGMRYTLLDASNYDLYTLLQLEEGRKPRFKIVLRDETFLEMQCLSLFLDPSIECEGKGEAKHMKFALKSKDRRNFDIVKNGKSIGTITTKTLISGDLSYDLTIDDADFDDYIPLFAVALERAFGEYNRE